MKTEKTQGERLFAALSPFMRAVWAAGFRPTMCGPIFAEFLANHAEELAKEKPGDSEELKIERLFLRQMLNAQPKLKNL